MVVVEGADNLISIRAAGAFGRPNGLGQMFLGWNELGEINELAGIYQTRRRKNGALYVRMNHYVQTNPQTAKQQSWRDFFKRIMSIWHNLSDIEKSFLEHMKMWKGMSGWNRYARAYMRRKPTDLGNCVLGMSELGELTF